MSQHSLTQSQGGALRAPPPQDYTQCLEGLVETCPFLSAEFPQAWAGLLTLTSTQSTLLTESEAWATRTEQKLQVAETDRNIKVCRFCGIEVSGKTQCFPEVKTVLPGSFCLTYHQLENNGPIPAGQSHPQDVGRVHDSESL